MKCKDCKYFDKGRQLCVRGCCYGIRDAEQECVLDDDKDKEVICDVN